jgi:type 2 lantibiotic biosynthesis protein LanM
MGLGYHRMRSLPGTGQLDMGAWPPEFAGPPPTPVPAMPPYDTAVAPIDVGIGRVHPKCGGSAPMSPGLVGGMVCPVSLPSATRPAWAEVVQAAVAASEAGLSAVSAVDTVSPSLDAFAVPLRPFIDLAKDQVAHGIQAGAEIDLSSVCERFAEQLSGRLVTLAARTLVLELNVARVSGRLRGSTGADRFADFVRHARLAPLFEEYPVLAQLLGQACVQAVDAQLELIERFVADRDAIVGTLLRGIDPGPLRAVEIDRGDLHQRGRSVSMLRFAGGATVVYKPRPQAMQAHFAEVVGWLNTKILRLDLRVPATLPRPGYGWVELITPGPCGSVADVDRFYRRQGALLAVLYALDATDIHYENLIAAGDQPVLIDVETLFHPSIEPPTMTGPDPARHALQTSVTRTALLPHLLIGEHGAVDISGLGGDKGVFPYDSVTWDASGTDEMRLVRRPAPFTGAVNRPRLDGRDVDPAEHRSALLSGFRAGYDAIVAHSNELTGLLERCAGDEIRVVLRPTRIYTQLLGESTHPDLLRDAAARNDLFEVLWTAAAHDPKLRAVIQYELADLWCGDVPYFVGRPGSRDIWTSDGDRLPALLDRSGLESVAAKINRMDELDRGDQEWLIIATMATRSGAADHRGGDPVPGPVAAAVPDQHRLLAAACGIADQIVARSLQDDHRANWFGLERLDGRNWAVLPMGAGLGDGYTGVALFLAQLGELTRSNRYRDLARKALAPLPALIETLGASPELASVVGPGGFAGLGGICYAISRLSTLLDDPDLATWLTPAIPIMERLASGPRGIATGQAGGLLSMMAVHAELGLKSAHLVAEKFASSLAETPVPSAVDEVFPPDGFAGGEPGVGYALRRFTGSTDVPAALDPDGYGWCTGLSGMVLAQSNVVDTTTDRWLAALTDRQPQRDFSLCHGELGVVEAPIVLAGLGHDLAAKATVHAAARVLGTLDRYGPRCGTPDGIPCAGLLTGLAGIGYGLLRLGFAEQVPSVLLLESKFSDPEP